MGIRIDPTLEFVWRDPATVQLGVDPPRAVVPVPTTGEERFLSAVRRETSRDALAALAATAGCAPGAAARVLGAAAPAVVDVSPAPSVTVEVHGDGALPDAVADLLAGEGVTVARTRPGAEHPVPVPDPNLAVVVADHVVDPALRAAWTRRDVPHLPVVVGDGRIRLGPFVVPGTGPCLQCVEYARTDDDPAWPAIAAQVWGRSAAPLSPWRVAAVAAATTRMLVRRLQHPTRVPDDEQVLLDRVDLSVRVRSVAPHPRCACRALPGTGSPSALRSVPTPVATTSP